MSQQKETVFWLLCCFCIDFPVTCLLKFQANLCERNTYREVVLCFSFSSKRIAAEDSIETIAKLSFTKKKNFEKNSLESAFECI